MRKFIMFKNKEVKNKINELELEYNKIYLNSLKQTHKEKIYKVNENQIKFIHSLIDNHKDLPINVLDEIIDRTISNIKLEYNNAIRDLIRYITLKTKY